MNAAANILWFLWLLLSVTLVFHFVGIYGLCNMFPEGRKAGHLPVQLLSLAFFAVAVLYNPWSR